MSTIVQVELPASGFALGRTLEKAPHIEVDIEQVAAHGTDYVFPLVWIIGDDLDSVNELLHNDPDVSTFEKLVELEDRRLYRMEWIAHIRLIIRILVEEDSTILDAHGKNGQWNLRVLFAEHAALSHTREFCERNEIPFNVKTIHRMSRGSERMFGLTSQQYEALVAATKRGYYKIPRDIGSEELATELNITPQALSERLRRGQETLNKNALGIDIDSSDGDGD